MPTYCDLVPRFRMLSLVFPQNPAPLWCGVPIPVNVRSKA